MSDLVKVAFIGAGDHASRAHADHLSKIEGVSIEGVFDPNNVTTAGFSKSYGVPKIYVCEDDVFADGDVDAVLIASPDRFHMSQLEKAVQSGKHVFCEKPMCNNALELESLSRVFAEAGSQGLVVTSCHPRRFDPPYVWLKDNLADLTAQYGQVMELRLDFTYHKPSKSGLHGGSMLQDHMNHEFDYATYLFGHSPVTMHRLYDEEDRYHVTGVRDDGIILVFGGSRRLESSTYGEFINVRFERASLQIDTHNPHNSQLIEHEGHHLVTVSLSEAGATDYVKRFMGINQNWIGSIRGNCENYLKPEDMERNSRVSVAFHDQPTICID